jgi:hypothetical protein
MMFGLPHLLSMRPFPELDVLKPRPKILFFASLCLVRQVIRAARIRYDRQVVFGLPHDLRMRSSPKLHVLKPWLNRFIFRLNRTLFWG